MDLSVVAVVATIAAGVSILVAVAAVFAARRSTAHADLALKEASRISRASISRINEVQSEANSARMAARAPPAPSPGGARGGRRAGWHGRPRRRPLRPPPRCPTRPLRPPPGCPTPMSCGLHSLLAVEADAQRPRRAPRLFLSRLGRHRRQRRRLPPPGMNRRPNRPLRPQPRVSGPAAWSRHPRQPPYSPRQCSPTRPLDRPPTHSPAHSHRPSEPSRHHPWRAQRAAVSPNSPPRTRRVTGSPRPAGPSSRTRPPAASPAVDTLRRT